MVTRYGPTLIDETNTLGKSEALAAIVDGMGMKKFIVTVKLPKNPDHNPHDKVLGKCPLSGGYCTDVTGEHHSEIITAYDIDAVRETYKECGLHVTRIEEI